MRKAYNLPPSCAVVTKSENLNSWNPLGLSRPAMGLLFYFNKVYILLVKIKFCLHDFCCTQTVSSGRKAVSSQKRPSTNLRHFALLICDPASWGSATRCFDTRYWCHHQRSKYLRRMKNIERRESENIQCSRNVGNQSSRNDESHPRRQMNRWGSRKLASFCTSGRNVLLRLYVSG